MIFREYATTGDGMIDGVLKILGKHAWVREGATLDELAADLTVFPQLLINVRVNARKPIEDLPGLWKQIRACESALDGSGRVHWCVFPGRSRWRE